MSHSFYEYKPKTGDFETRRNGVLIAFEEGVATFYALKNAEDRGVYFIKPGVKVYKGMIIGENKESSSKRLASPNRKANECHCKNKKERSFVERRRSETTAANLET